jgi:predicted AAA+ superfamily ATPase
MTLYPWSFREHVALRGLRHWSFEIQDRAIDGQEDPHDVMRELGAAPPDETERLETALLDYLMRGGFPEAALAADLGEARRRLRQDILDRALGRDVLDVVNVDARTLERMFLHICMHPGGLWNEAEMARELGITRPTVSKYLRILEQAFLVFRLPNLSNAVRGQPKVYLVAPALRQALLALDEEGVREPQEWGVLAENTVIAAAMSGRDTGTRIGFWRSPRSECDLVELGDSTRYVEIKRSGKKPRQGIEDAAAALAMPGSGTVLAREWRYETLLPWDDTRPLRSLTRMPLAVWLYAQKASALGGPVLNAS